jgi:citrate lyase subunit beta/citryl-CoA lyase
MDKDMADKDIPSSVRPRRSALYMPASNMRALEKARGLDADIVIFDLEDAVAPEQKTSARDTLKTALDNGGYDGRETVLRINGRDTEWFADDMAFAATLPVDAVLVPKVDTPQDIASLGSAMAALGKALWVMVETPASLLNLPLIAAAAQTSPLAALVLGSNDLAKDMRLVPDAPRTAFQPVLTQMVAAARAYGLIALDGVCNAIGDPDQLAAECAQGRSFGFDGKTLIHPSQIAVANQAFAPSAEDLGHAQSVIAAFADPQNTGAGVLKVNGKMTERLHLIEAKRLVAEAQMIANRSNG